MGWLIRHRFVSLAFISGLFEVMRRLLTDSSIKSSQDFTHMMMPHSPERARFWASVISCATNFLNAPKNASIVSHLITIAEDDQKQHNKSSQSNNGAKRIYLRNSQVKDRLSLMVAEEVWQFFNTLKNSEGLCRGEVISANANVLLTRTDQQQYQGVTEGHSCSGG